MLNADIIIIIILTNAIQACADVWSRNMDVKKIILETTEMKMWRRIKGVFVCILTF